MKEDRESWLNSFTWLKGRGLAGVRLIIGDKCLGMLESIPVVFPEAKYQRCTVHFYRTVFTVTPKTKMKQVTFMLTMRRRAKKQLRKRRRPLHPSSAK